MHIFSVNSERVNIYMTDQEFIIANGISMRGC